MQPWQVYYGIRTNEFRRSKVTYIVVIWNVLWTAWYIHHVLSIVCPVVTAHKIWVTDIVQSGQPKTCVCPGHANNLRPLNPVLFKYSNLGQSWRKFLRARAPVADIFWEIISHVEIWIYQTHIFYYSIDFLAPFISWHPWQLPGCLYL